MRKILFTAMATAAVVLTAATPAAAAPTLSVSPVTFSTDHIDVTGGPGTVVLSFTVTDADPDGREISGSAEIRQFAGDTAVGATWTIPYDAAISGSTAAIRMFIGVPQYGATPEAVWRVTKLTVRDTVGNFRTLRGEALPEVGVTQRVDSADPQLDGIALGPGQSDVVTDPGDGAIVDYRVTVTDLQAGFWKGRIVLTGSGGQQAKASFAVASDGRHLTCGTASLIDDIYAEVECYVPVVIPAGVWSVQRVALTDQANHTTIVNRPAAPVVTVTHS